MVTRLQKQLTEYDASANEIMMEIVQMGKKTEYDHRTKKIQGRIIGYDFDSALAIE